MLKYCDDDENAHQNEMDGESDDSYPSFRCMAVVKKKNPTSKWFVEIVKRGEELAFDSFLYWNFFFQVGGKYNLKFYYIIYLFRFLLDSTTYLKKKNVSCLVLGFV